MISAPKKLEKRLTGKITKNSILYVFPRKVNVANSRKDRYGASTRILAKIIVITAILIGITNKKLRSILINMRFMLLITAPAKKFK